MTDRVRFITHQRKQVLLVDLSNSSAAEVEKILRALPDVVTTPSAWFGLDTFRFHGSILGRGSHAGHERSRCL
jgi:hypothetical protein